MSLIPRAPARLVLLALVAAMAVTILPSAAVRQASAAVVPVYFSEYIEGSGNDKALEIYNGTGAPLDLGAGGYRVKMYFNGATSTTGSTLTIALTGTVAAGDVFVLAHGSASAAILAQADYTSGTTTGWFNGDDAIELASTVAGNVLDTIGQVGNDPGTEWGSGLTSTQDNILRRKGSVHIGDSNGADAFDPSVEWDGFLLDTMSDLGSHTVGDSAPSVAGSSPVDGAVNVAQNASLSVDFSEEVVIADGSVILTCDGVDQGATVSGDPGTHFELVYLPPLPQGAACAITISAAGVTDTDADDPPDVMAGPVSIDFTITSPDPCAGVDTPIGAIQGTGETVTTTSPVTIQGVVVGDYEGPSPALRGFYVQNDAAGDDDDAATSDAIFVFTVNSDTVDLGDVVQVTGTPAENQGQSQLGFATTVECGTGGTIAPANVDFPVATATSLERFEGMLVRVPETMTVTEHFQLGRFGQVVISSDGRLVNPTAVVSPGQDAIDLQAANNLRKVIVDDALQSQNPDPIVFGRGDQPLSAANTLRGGDTITGLTGVMTYTWAGNAASGNAYRIRPINALVGSATFVAANQRPGPTVEIEGDDVRIAALNLLNYFNTFDGLPDTVNNCRNGTLGPLTDCRGADTAAEFARQTPKTVAAILGLGADVVGVNEIENDGYGPTSSLQHLTDALNGATAPDTWAFIDVDAETGQVDALGDDAIKVGLLYRPAHVTPVGDTAALNDPAFTLGGDALPTDPNLPRLRSRPSLAQAFEVVATGAQFVVDVNHFKSKGSACDVPDAGDGQGNCNVVRTNGAEVLVDWLADDPTGTDDDDVFIMGDLNSYALEDPITVLTDGGYTNLVDEFIDDPYSYVFDGQWGYLDHALGSSAAVAEVVGVVEWHINSDEPSVLDYNLDFKSPAQQASLYEPDRFRVSDHDPIVVGLDPVNDPPVIDTGAPYAVEEHDVVTLDASAVDPEDSAVTVEWDFDGDGIFETAGPTPTFSAATLEAPQTVTVHVRATDAWGNASTTEVDIDVIWDFGGFLAPSNPGGVTSVNAGSALPIRFSLDGAQGLSVLDGDPTFQRTNCTTGASIGSSFVTAASEPFSYSAATDAYTFTWKTQKAWAGWCGTVRVALDDGTTHDLAIRFKG
ncbi:MAG TPA: ExeM/NucH family extracellular endonuclease [Candidatus Saccharimonadales bacterium]|nr:ExeM/NucH family extracellular endonuclease [Candidatus Saccharimonadales bacterium]